jgi:carboxypeptidase Q
MLAHRCNFPPLPSIPPSSLHADYTSPGAAFPDELVVVSGHMDSWDLAEGGMDDGGGFFTAWEAVRLIKSLGLFSNRTIRAIGWVDEEGGGLGAVQYGLDYNYTFPSTSLAMESDTGAFGLYGLSYVGGPSALLQLQTLAPLLAGVGATNVTVGGDDTDEAVLCAQGVPCGALWPYDPRVGPAANNPCLQFSAALVPPTMPFHVSDGYMWYHHTESDTVDKMDPGQLQTIAAANAIWALSVANLPTLLPRD